MAKTDPDLTRWLNTAVSGIKFKPDRAAVEAELRGHMEDKMEALLGYFPSMTPEEAEQRTLKSMGDPAEVGRELAKVHRPWLGYLWRATQVFLWAVILVSVGYMFSMEHPNEGKVWGGDIPRAPAFFQETLDQEELGGYTFRLLNVEYAPEDGRVRAVFRASSPKFWERISPLAIDDLVIHLGEDSYPIGMIENERIISSCSNTRWGLFYREFTAYVIVDDPPPQGTQVRLDFHFGLGDFTLSAPLESVETR